VVAEPSTIGRQFDYIAYQRGGSTLLMINHAMTPARWQYGMQIYLNERKYTNTV
jgi:aminopeptidase N